MRKLLLASAVAALLAACNQAPVEEKAAEAPAAPAGPTRAIVQVSGDVYRYQNNNHFGVFLVTPEGVIVADPINAEAAEWLKGEIAARFNGAVVKQVLYSHNHWDHASGAAVFTDAPVLAHVDAVKALQGPPADAPLAPGQAAQDANKDGKLQLTEVSGPLAENFTVIDADADGGITAREFFLDQFKNVKVPDQTYPGGVRKVTLGGKTVELHHVGGNHASDLSYIYFPAEKVLFVVDVISLKRLPFQNLAGYDEKDSFGLIDKAIAFDADFIVGGHGEIGADADIQDVKTYLTELRAGVQKGINAGQTPEQIAAALPLEKYASWASYDTWRVPNIEGMYAYLKK